MKALVEQLRAETGFHGLCGFDCIQDAETGQLSIVEFHPRCSSGFGWGRYAGVDVPKVLSDLLLNQQGATQNPWSQEELGDAPVCCYFPHHLDYALAGHWRNLRYWLPEQNAAS